MRKTKIICTLGPSTDKDGVLEELVKEGLNVVLTSLMVYTMNRKAVLIN
mgnify:CR=1 FL=1